MNYQYSISQMNTISPVLCRLDSLNDWPRQTTESVKISHNKQQNGILTSQVGLPWWLSGKESTCKCRTCRFDPWVGTIPWRRTGNPLQYSCLGNPMYGGTWQAIVHGVKKVWHNLTTKQQQTSKELPRLPY